MKATYETTILKTAVHLSSENPVFGEGVTYVGIDDEAGGAFLVLEQETDDGTYNKIRIDYEEFLAVVEAAKFMMSQKSVADKKE